MDYRLSWTIMDDRGLFWIIIDYNGLWTMVDYHEFLWIMDYHGLAWLEGLITDYGLSWILEYAAPWNRTDCKICSPNL